MEKITVYQLVCEGGRKNFSRTAIMYHKNVFINKEDITEEVKEEFLDACCETDIEDPKSMFDLKRETCKLAIVELNLIK